MASFITVCSSLLLAVLVALSVQIFYFSPIDPLLLDLKPATTTRDNKLQVKSLCFLTWFCCGVEELVFMLVFFEQNIIKLGEGAVKEPEDVCVDKEGSLYTATRDGWIKRMRRNGDWENWKYIGGDTLIGVTQSKEGGIIVCDANKVNSKVQHVLFL